MTPRGRPRKDLSISTPDLYDWLVLELKRSLGKIHRQARQAVNQDRTDTIRTSLIRLIKKIPYLALVKLARRADYKARSDEIHKFKHAYSLTVGRFAQLLDHAGMEHNMSAD